MITTHTHTHRGMHAHITNVSWILVMYITNIHDTFGLRSSNIISATLVHDLCAIILILTTVLIKYCFLIAVFGFWLILSLYCPSFPSSLICNIQTKSSATLVPKMQTCSKNANPISYKRSAQLQTFVLVPQNSFAQAACTVVQARFLPHVDVSCHVV